MDFEVQHEEGKRYYATIDGYDAAVGYHRVDAHTVDFQHTYVAPELRGRGIADVLVRHALDDARGRGDRVIPSCPFVRKFVERHPEYRQDAARG
jgi:predicted GNAT family acetyltransferase